MITFAIHQSIDADIETKCIILYAIYQRIPIQYFTKAKDVFLAQQVNPTLDLIPVGTVEWVEGCMNASITPNYYPEFLSNYLGRRVWKETSWPLNQRVFIKPADTYKRFNGRCTTGGWRGKKKGPYWCSEIIHFQDEWRYYITKGRVVYAAWYQGVTEDLPPPELNIDWPDTFSGSVDFGYVPEQDKILLVEAHEPFAIGWYGSLSNYKIYGQWVVDSWEYLKQFYNNKEHEITLPDVTKSGN